MPNPVGKRLILELGARTMIETTNLPAFRLSGPILARNLDAGGEFGVRCSVALLLLHAILCKATGR